MLSLQLVLGSAGLLLIIGLMMVFSASSIPAALGHRSVWHTGIQQALWACVGIAAAGVALLTPAAVLRRWSGRSLLLIAFLLLVVLVPGVGVKVGGARKWFNLGVGYFQPSEFAKLAFGLWGAHLIVLRQRFLTTRTLLLPIVPVFAGLAALIVVEPDFGSAVSFLVVLVGLLWAGGAPRRVWFWLIGVSAVAAFALISLAPYRAARFTSFLNPFADPRGNGFQEIQGMYALASGGVWGLGIGNSHEKWGLLPNAQSDYIFAIIGEELGFLGCLVVVVLYAVLAYAGCRIALRSNDRFARVVSMVLTVSLVVQAVMNMGYVVGMLPVTGVTLPLVSQGGTSLVLALFEVGLLARFACAEPDAAALLQQRFRSPLMRRLLAASGDGRASEGDTRRRSWPPGGGSRPRNRKASDGQPVRSGGRDGADDRRVRAAAVNTRTRVGATASRRAPTSPSNNRRPRF
ncbi:MAG TPA: putative lipid II flippase FtsW [Blastococcus sp.]|jgi:cell division protein FtsW|nr:putative lipid II flippase FtsW [Blastococcus sp.]